MDNNSIKNITKCINKILLGIVLLLSFSVDINCQVKIAFSHGFSSDYMEALISDTLIKVKNTPDYIIDTLNEAANYLEKKHSIILCPIGYFGQQSLDSISKNIESFRTLISRDHLKNKSRLCNSINDTTEIGSKQRKFYNLITTNTPIATKIFNAWSKTYLIDDYLSNPELELSGISIIEYLKQEYYKILSRPLPESTLDYGITNEDFWPINDNTNENEAEDTNTE